MRRSRVQTGRKLVAKPYMVLRSGRVMGTLCPLIKLALEVLVVCLSRRLSCLGGCAGTRPPGGYLDLIVFPLAAQ